MNESNLPIKSAAELTRFESKYSEQGFWEKIKKLSKKAGSRVIYAALTLYYAMKSPDISARDKAIIVGALGYFILPFDIFPDFIVGGFIDDLGALLFALKSVYGAITPETKAEAKAHLIRLFGEVDENEIDIF